MNVLRRAKALPMWLAAAALAVAFDSLLAAQELTQETEQRELVVCADPDNLPFSNGKLEGFENKIAALVAQELHASLRYAWNAQPRGFRPRALETRTCDLVIGVPAGLPGVAVTRPYYASAYVFVTARSRKLALESFDDPALRSLKIGLHAIGSKGANTPPASALARRGLASNVVGYAMWGTGDEPNPQGKIIEAVAHGEIDAALVWGPLAGYFAKRYTDQLVLAPVVSDPQMPALAFSYDISFGVRQGNDALKAELQEVLERKQHDIKAILIDYGIPLVAATPTGSLRQGYAPGGSIALLK
jgi:quinoprotein dehydrogenase-associated probable ABC transporter substrate-binding protein